MINTLTLNPAIDRVLYLDKLEKNVTARIHSSAETIGGKGTHVSINLKLLGTNSRVLGIAHGPTGQKILEILRTDGLETCFVERGNKNSRTNYILVESTHDCTVVAEKGVLLTEEDIQDVISMMTGKIQEGDYLVLSGDASNCPNSRVYNIILDALKDKKLKVFLDTSGETLKRCISSSPFLIKPNLDELCTLCRRKVTNSTEDVIAAIDSLSDYAIKVIAVSMGKIGSIVKYENCIYKTVPPEVPVINTVGCGDAFLASLIYGISKGMPVVDTLRLATAVSSATAESPLSVGFNKERAEELVSRVIVQKVR